MHRREPAWEAKRKGLPLIQSQLQGKFDYYAETHYNETDVSYDIVLEVYGRDPFGSLEPVLVHRENYSVFPSDHLMTKLILLVG